MHKYIVGISMRSLLGAEFVHVDFDLYICFFRKNPGDEQSTR